MSEKEGTASKTPPYKKREKRFAEEASNVLDHATEDEADRWMVTALIGEKTGIHFARLVDGIASNSKCKTSQEESREEVATHTSGREGPPARKKQRNDDPVHVWKMDMAQLDRGKVQEIEEKLNRLLGKNLYVRVDKPAGTKAKTTKPYFDSKKSFPGGFKREETVEGALDYLKQHKENANDDEAGVRFENNFTQWAVNRMLWEVKDILGESIADDIKQNFPLGKALSDDLELHYYEETNPEHKSTMKDRKPDSAFYVAGKGAETSLNREMQQLGMLVPLEHKSCIDDPRRYRDALWESQRDHAERLKAEVASFSEPAVGFGIVTDGIIWKFLKMRAKLRNDYSKTFYHWIEVSDAVTIVRADGDGYEFGVLAGWLLFVMKQSLIERTGASGYKAQEFKLQQNPTLKRRVAVLKEEKYFSLVGRHTVAVVSAISSGGKYVLKLPRLENPNDLDGGFTDDDLRKAKSILREREFLIQLQDCSGIVNLAPVALKRPALALLTEFAGIALTNLVVSGQAGKRMAVAIHSDIWCGALKALHAKKLCHSDIHPGNICIKEVGGLLKAALIDLESVVEHDEPLAGSPVLHRIQATEGKGSENLDKISVCAVLECLWNYGSFDELVVKIGEHAGHYGITNDAPAIIADVARGEILGLAPVDEGDEDAPFDGDDDSQPHDTDSDEDDDSE